VQKWDRRRPECSPEERTDAAVEHRQLYECLAVRPKNAREFPQVRRYEPASRQVLKDEVADEDVCDVALDSIQAFAADGVELNVVIRDNGPRASNHRRRDVDCKHLVEALRECRSHPARATTDLDADAAVRIRAKTSEEALELEARTGGVADVRIAVGTRKRVPRRAHPRQA
jgi:hypothetical protein